MSRRNALYLFEEIAPNAIYFTLTIFKQQQLKILQDQRFPGVGVTFADGYCRWSPGNY